MNETLRYAAQRRTPFAPHLVSATMSDLFILVGRGLLSVVLKSHDRTHFQITELGAAECERLENETYRSIQQAA